MTSVPDADTISLRIVKPVPMGPWRVHLHLDSEQNLKQGLR